MAKYSVVSWTHKFPQLEQFAGENKLSALDFTTATWNLLHRTNVHLVSDLLDKSPAAIMRSPFAEERILFEVERFLRALNESLFLEEVEGDITMAKYSVVSWKYKFPQLEQFAGENKLSALDFTTVTWNLLHRIKVKTVSELLEKSPTTIKGFTFVEEKMVFELEHFLQVLNTSLLLVEVKIADESAYASASCSNGGNGSGVTEKCKIYIANEDHDQLFAMKFFERFVIEPRLRNVQLEIYSTLSTYLKNRLRNHMILTVEDLLDKSEFDLSTHYGFSTHLIRTIIKFLSELSEAELLIPCKRSTPKALESDQGNGDPFAKEYSYEDSIEKLGLSVRSYNALRRMGIETIDNLMEFPEDKFSNQKNIGIKTLNEILDTRKMIGVLEQNISAVRPNRKQIDGRDTTIIYNLMKQYANDVACGDFTFLDGMKLSIIEAAYIDLYKCAQADLGEELALHCVYMPQFGFNIMEMFLKFDRIAEQKKELTDLFNVLPPHRKNQSAVAYVCAFSSNEDIRIKLNSFYKSDTASLDSILMSDEMIANKDYLLVKQFISSCAFSIEKQLEDIYQSMLKDDRLWQIIEMRAAKMTLQDVGIKFRVTRERIRQLEKKAFRRFSSKQRKTRLLSNIAADRNGDYILTRAEIRIYAGEKTDAIVYLLKNTPSSDYLYDAELDVFILGDDSLSTRASAYIEKLPATILKSEILSILKDANELENIPSEILEKGIAEAYVLTGETYRRTQLNREIVYASILKEFYPDGMRVYDATELNKFREYIAMRYGNIKIAQNDRALSAGIARLSV